jgi:DNA-binding MarR family transcriptional regulator
VFQVVNEQSKRAEHETGLTGPQLWAIKVISESEPIKASDLARKMFLHPATVFGIIDRLEARGFVERKRSAKDRRIIEIVLTEQGRYIIRQSPEVAQGLIVSRLEALSENKLKNLSTTLKQLVKILEAQEIPPQLIIHPKRNHP